MYVKSCTEFCKGVWLITVSTETVNNLAMSVDIVILTIFIYVIQD